MNSEHAYGNQGMQAFILKCHRSEGGGKSNSRAINYTK